MRFRSACSLGLLTLATVVSAQESSPATDDAAMLRKIYDTALVESPAYGQLAELVTRFPGRLSGTRIYNDAAKWAATLLQETGADRVELQPVMVPHWERGAPESVVITQITAPVPPARSDVTIPLPALALGGSVATPPDGINAPVIELQSLAEVATAGVEGKIVFFNRPMDPKTITPGSAYGGAVDQRSRGATEAAKHGAVGVLVRSMTHAISDLPHTGSTTYLPGNPKIPAAAISTNAANTLSALLQRAGGDLTVRMTINAKTHPDAEAHNVIGEIRGSESPGKIILVGGHLDSWDIAPGAHDDGTGCIQSIEVLRILRDIGYTPRHTIRCVLYANEENGLRGALEYTRVVDEKKEEHLLALETDSGGYHPVGFNLGNAAGNAHARAARWKDLFEPYGIFLFKAGKGGADVGPLMAKGYTVAGLVPDSQRYFDYHHTRADSLDKVNRREFELGAAAMAALVYLVDRHGL